MRGLQASFRVYLPRRKTSAGRRCANTYRFWEVRIFDSPDNLRAFLASSDLPGGAFIDCKRTIGYCRALHKRMRSGKWMADPRGRRGLVGLCFPACGAGAVSHEWTHAAHYELTTHLGRKSLPLKDHEQLAWLQGEFVRRFWNAFYRRFKLRGRRWVAV